MESVIGASGGFLSTNVSHLMREDLVKLDIYAEKATDIENCKRELEKKLEGAMITTVWRQKATYADDKEFIRKLNQEQVGSFSHFMSFQQKTCLSHLYLSGV